MVTWGQINITKTLMMRCAIQSYHVETAEQDAGESHLLMPPCQGGVCPRQLRVFVIHGSALPATRDAVYRTPFFSLLLSSP